MPAVVTRAPAVRSTVPMKSWVSSSSSTTTIRAPASGVVLASVPARLSAARSASAVPDVATGSVTVNVAPWPTPGLLAATRPPCRSTSWRTMARPIPRPPCRRVVELSAWRKRSNTCGRTSGSMPMPVSVTVSVTVAPLPRTRTSTRPPGSVNLTALLTRFHTT